MSDELAPPPNTTRRKSCFQISLSLSLAFLIVASIAAQIESATVTILPSLSSLGVTTGIVSPAFAQTVLQPVHVGSITSISTTELDGPSEIFVSGNYAYVTGYADDGIQIIDVSNPEAPVAKGSITIPALFSDPIGIFVSGNYAYVTSDQNEGVQIIDVSDPEAPVLKGSITIDTGTEMYDNFGSYHGATDVFVSGNYAYITTNYVGETSNYAYAYVEIIDISDPANPIFVSIIPDPYDPQPVARAHIYVSGNYAYTTLPDSDSVNIFDISDFVNEPPVVSDLYVTTYEDASTSLNLSATDPDDDTLSYSIISSPSSGTISDFDSATGQLTYTPNTGFTGTDSFTYTATDSSGAFGNTSTVTVTITSLNNPPVASDLAAITTDEDMPVSLTLAASDIEGNALSYAIASPPSHGTLSGLDSSTGQLTYTPAADYGGADSFTYTASDGIATSNTATISITINAVNDQPVADSQSATTSEDAPVDIALTGSDIEDGMALTYTLTSPPGSGTLSGTAPSLTYTPDANSNGADEFKFKVTDGESLDSAEATVSIAVSPVNDDPVANPQSLVMSEDATRIITLAGSDVEGGTLTFSIVSSPSIGTLSGFNSSAGEVTYTPNANKHGDDTFTFTVNDGSVDSIPATVSITILFVPDFAPSLTVTTDEDSPVDITVLSGQSSTTVVMGSQPSYGVATVNADYTITYTPDADYSGQDFFTYRLSDDPLDPFGSISVTVEPLNDQPIAADDSASTSEGTAVTIDVLANDSDIDSTALTVSSPTEPANGSAIRNSDGTITYKPDPGFAGADTFTYKVSDGFLADSATVTVTVSAVNNSPVADSQSASTEEGAPLLITLTASDFDGDALEYAVIDSPAHGVLSGAAPDLTYTPNADYSGEDSFTYAATDSAGAVSNTATVTISISPQDESDIAMAYKSGSTGTVAYREWDTSTGAWGSEIELSSAGAEIQAVKFLYSPVDNMRAIGTLDASGEIEVYYCEDSCTSSSSWTGPTLVADMGTPDTSANARYKYFDMAFESSSGDLLIVYDKTAATTTTSSTDDFWYRVLDADTFTLGSETGYDYVSDTFTDNDHRFFKMVSKPDSDEIAMVLLDATFEDTYAFIWDGSSFGNKLTLSSAIGTTSKTGEAIGVAYETGSGAALVVSANGPNSAAFARYKSSWSPVSTYDPNPAAGNEAIWFTVKADPASGSDRVMACNNDSLSDWSCTQITAGTAGTSAKHETATGATIRRTGDFAWDPTGNAGITVYWDTSAKDMRYRTWSGSTWSAETTIPVADANTVRWVAGATPSEGANSLWAFFSDTTANPDDIGSGEWDGTAFASNGESSITGDGGTNTFMDIVSIGTR